MDWKRQLKNSSNAGQRSMANQVWRTTDTERNGHRNNPNKNEPLAVDRARDMSDERRRDQRKVRRWWRWEGGDVGAAVPLAHTQDWVSDNTERSQQTVHIVHHTTGYL
jgi:hypothetical protein